MFVLRWLDIIALLTHIKRQNKTLDGHCQRGERVGGGGGEREREREIEGRKEHWRNEQMRKRGGKEVDGRDWARKKERERERERERNREVQEGVVDTVVGLVGQKTRRCSLSITRHLADFTKKQNIQMIALQYGLPVDQVDDAREDGVIQTHDESFQDIGEVIVATWQGLHLTKDNASEIFL